MLESHGYGVWVANLHRPLPEVIVLELGRLMTVLKEGNERLGVRLISDILKLDCDSEEFWRAVTSLELWGGSGSLFDQAFVDGDGTAKSLRDEFYLLMFDLSRLIEQCGHANRFVSSARAVLRELVWQQK